MKRIITFFIFCCVLCTNAFCDTVSINWSGLENTTSCESGGDIIVPNATPPEPIGKHFVGWTPAFRRIEYLESTGTQYIDTGFIADQNSAVFVDQHTLSNTSGNAIFGSRQGYRTRGFFISADVNGGNFFHVEYGANAIINNKNDFQRHTLELNKGTLYIDNVLKGTIYTTNFTTVDTLHLFGCNGPENFSQRQRGRIRIYKFSIWDNDVLVRDYVPVLDYNDVACMYDKVSGNFVYNSGTGDFIAGPEITSDIIDISAIYVPNQVIENACSNYFTDFFPQYEQNIINITWDDTMGNISNYSCTYDEDITIPPAPNRVGYTFIGWKVKNN